MVICIVWAVEERHHSFEMQWCFTYFYDASRSFTITLYTTPVFITFYSLFYLLYEISLFYAFRFVYFSILISISVLVKWNIKYCITFDTNVFLINERIFENDPLNLSIVHIITKRKIYLLFLTYSVPYVILYYYLK